MEPHPESHTAANAIAAGWGGLLEDYLCDSDSEEKAQSEPSAALDVVPGSFDPVWQQQRPQLPPAVMSTLTPLSPLGCTTELFHPTLCAVEDLLSTRCKQPLDPNVQKLSSFYFHRANKLHTTKEAVSQMLGMESTKIEATLGLLSCTATHLDWAARNALETRLSQSGLKCLCYMDLKPLR